MSQPSGPVQHSGAPLRLGIAGLGTVGIGVVKIVQRHADLLAARTGRPIAITAICARDRTKNRDADLSGYAWEDSAVALAQRPDTRHLCRGDGRSRRCRARVA